MYYLLAAGLIAAAIYEVVTGAKKRKARLEGLREFAEQMDMDLVQDKADHFPDLKPFLIHNPLTLAGPVAEPPVLTKRVGDVTIHFANSLLKRTMNHKLASAGHFQACLMRVADPNLNLPSFALCDRRNPLGVYASGKDVPSENATFDSRFQLVGEDVEAVQRYFDAPLREALLRNSTLVYVDGCGQRLLVYIHAELKEEVVTMLLKWLDWVRQALKSRDDS